jgi:hypothetical protein
MKAPIVTLAWILNYGDSARDSFQWFLAIPAMLSPIERDGLDIPLHDELNFD